MSITKILSAARKEGERAAHDRIKKALLGKQVDKRTGKQVNSSTKKPFAEGHPHYFASDGKANLFQANQGMFGYYGSVSHYESIIEDSTGSGGFESDSGNFKKALTALRKKGFIIEYNKTRGNYVITYSPITKKHYTVEYKKNGTFVVHESQGMFGINASDIPQGTTKEDIKERNTFIKKFYANWSAANPTKQIYNANLTDYINVKYLSMDETATHAARRYKSTIAVTYLTDILTKAKLIKREKPKPNNKNQKQFSEIILMEYSKVDFGKIKLTVGVLRGSGQKIQYCITAIE
jgi:hypothetical protein